MAIFRAEWRESGSERNAYGKKKALLVSCRCFP